MIHHNYEVAMQFVQFGQLSISETGALNFLGRPVVSVSKIKYINLIV